MPYSSRRIAVSIFSSAVFIYSTLNPVMAENNISETLQNQLFHNTSGPMSEGDINNLIQKFRVELDYETLHLIELLADSGNNFALQSLGDLYSRGPIPIDGGKAVDYYQRAAAAGRSDSLVRLGDLYHYGNVVSLDVEKAFSYYQEAIDNGNKFAQLRLGVGLIKGTLSEKDETQGLALLEALADSNDSGALFELGELYSKGPLPINGEKAVSYHERAAAAGRIDSFLRLGDLYHYGNVVSLDAEKALSYYQEAMANGNKFAQLRLGVGLIKGTLSEKDETQGLALLEALADSNDSGALFELGELYSKGPLPINGEKAVSYHERAAAAGRIDSFLRLGDLYHYGNVVSLDAEKALSYYQEAMANGNKFAQLRLGMGLIKGTLSDKDEAQGLALLEALADSNDSSALYELGELYSKGPLQINGKKAVSYHERAAAAGRVDSFVRLGDFYHFGNVVDLDVEKALSYYQKAMANGNKFAQLRLGVGLINGTLSEKDEAQGLALLEALADSNDSGALYELGELYSKGPLQINGEKAISYYERAAAAGRTWSMVRLGNIFRDGDLIKSDPIKAISLYEKAYSMGETSALEYLAVGHLEKRFGRLSKPEKGVNILENEMKNGNVNAYIILSNAYFNGKGVIKSPERGLRLLSQAADAGSVNAARNLIAALRNGKGEGLPRNLLKAKSSLDKYALLFAEHDLEIEKFLLKSVHAGGDNEFAELFLKVSESPNFLKQRALVTMHGINKNFYTWMLQNRLGELGYYKVKPSGIMNAATIQSINIFCKKNNIQTKCAQGPLHWITASALAINLYQ